MQARLQQIRPLRAQDRRRRWDREPRGEAAQQQHDGRRAERRQGDDRAECDGVHDRERQQHAPRADPVDEPALHRRANPRTRRQRPRDSSATANEPVCSRR